MILRVTLDRISTFTFGAKKNLNRRNRQKFKSIFYIVIYFEMKRISFGMLKVKKKNHFIFPDNFLYYVFTRKVYFPLFFFDFSGA